MKLVGEIHESYARSTNEKSKCSRLDIDCGKKRDQQIMS